MALIHSWFERRDQAAVNQDCYKSVSSESFLGEVVLRHPLRELVVTETAVMEEQQHLLMGALDPGDTTNWEMLNKNMT